VKKSWLKRSGLLLLRSAQVRPVRKAASAIPNDSPAVDAIATRDVRMIDIDVTSRTTMRRFLDWASTCPPF
jgi:hypothetical protein